MRTNHRLQQLVSTLKGLPRLWWGFSLPVTREAYLISAVLLFTIKYLGDMGIAVFSVGHVPWSFLHYLAPFWGHLLPMAEEPWALASMILWTLPFLWIGATLTARRAKDSGITPSVALGFFVPGLNYCLVLALGMQHSIEREPEHRIEGEPTESDSELLEQARGFRHLLGSLAWGASAGLLAFVGPFFVLDSPYGFALFAGGPFWVGLVTAFLHGRKTYSMGQTQGVVQLALVIGLAALLFFGIEGAICLAMVYPLAAPLAALGGLMGHAFAQPHRFGRAHSLSQIWIFLLLAPFLTALDHGRPMPEYRELVTTVEVDAPPEAVWPHVIQFTELPPADELVFKLGIAHPIRARIEGEGVGAIRYCEFSTGPFVEPITRWEEPYRLSFDVTAQPPTMEEWSPYDIHPPHLTESLTSQRGEFRLIPLPGGRTRLEGSTWYRHDLYPQVYWNLWSDTLIHTIHRRVLHHIADRSRQPRGIEHRDS